MRDGDSQTSRDIRIGDAAVDVETLGEVMIRIKRKLVEYARAGTAETGGDRAC